jgi:hypothetical protein
LRVVARLGCGCLRGIEALASSGLVAGPEVSRDVLELRGDDLECVLRLERLVTGETDENDDSDPSEPEGPPESLCVPRNWH